jgi:hypothetical protein
MCSRNRDKISARPIPLERLWRMCRIARLSAREERDRRSPFDKLTTCGGFV